MFFAIFLHTVGHVLFMEIEAGLGGFIFAFPIFVPLFQSHKGGF